MALREEQILTVVEYRLLRGIFRPKRDEVTGGLRKLHNEEFYNVHPSPSIIRMIGMYIEYWLECKKETDH
jgi:hypothetical protein